jgi:hypothetical protein
MQLYPKENILRGKKILFAKGKHSVMYLAVTNIVTVAYNKGEPYIETSNRYDIETNVHTIRSTQHTPKKKTQSPRHIQEY